MGESTGRRARRSDAFGGGEYRAGALGRLGDAHRLLRAERFAASAYLPGRAVEGMPRALIWETDKDIRQGKKSLETGHDLRELLALVRHLGLLRPGDRDVEFEVTVQRVGRLWFNNMRFAS